MSYKGATNSHRQYKSSFSERVIVYLALFVVSAGILYILFSPKDESYINKYKIQIETLESKVDSLHSINDVLVYEIDSINQHILKLDKEINLQDNKIITLKKQTNEKIISVDFFNNDELERFFTERYNRQYLDTVKNPNSKTRN